MDFELTSEQLQFKDSVEAWLDDHYGFAKRRSIVAKQDGFSRRHWEQFAELGWLGLPIAESCGGLGGSAVDTNILLEGFGSRLVAEPYLPTVLLGARLLERCGTAEQQRTHLPRVVAGRELLAFAHGEPRSRFDRAFVETRATATAAGFVIDGNKSVVLNGASADTVIVSARTAGRAGDRDGISLFLVEAGASGLTRRDYPTIDGRRAAELRFDGVEVGREALLGEPDRAFTTIDEVLDRAACAICAEAVGAMQAALALTREYLGMRRQFGTTLGQHQVLRHRFVDMFIALEESRSMTAMAAMRIDAGAADRQAVCAATKAKVGRAARFVGEQTIQLHGGIGMTDAYPAGHFYKRLAAIDTMFGSADFELNRFAAMSTD